MTTIFDKGPGTTPAVHAFVIGVGDYPFLKDGEQARPEPWGLGQLSSAPLSALELATWLETELALPDEDPQKPGLELDSLELLVSQKGPQPSFQPKDGSAAIPVERATMANVTLAFKRWLDRCQRSEDNLALFFFSGHGFAKGGWQGLLLDGFDPDAPDLFNEVIAFDEFVLGMDQCLARRQCFLIDACRTPLPELRDLDAPRGARLIAPRFNSASDIPRDACIIRATAPQQAAYGIQDKPTRFTSALLRALQGAGSSRPGARWEVRTDSIVTNLNALLRYDAIRKHLPVQEVRLSGDSNGFVLHVPSTPKIPIVIGCTPEADTLNASLKITHRQQPVGDRPSGIDTDWELELAIHDDEYDISASFQDGPERKQTLRAQPPLCEVRL